MKTFYMKTFYFRVIYVAGLALALAALAVWVKSSSPGSWSSAAMTGSGEFRPLSQERGSERLKELRYEMALLRLKMARAGSDREFLEAQARGLLQEYNALAASVKGVGIQPGGKGDEDDSAKVAMHARMRELQTIIESLVVQLGQDPDNEEIQQQLAAAQAEFDSISSELGGDVPTAQASGIPPRGTIPPRGSNGTCEGTLQNFSTSPGLRIPASGTRGTITSTLEVSGAGPYLLDLNLQTAITHTFNADLDITLTSPAGTVVTITTDNGGSSDNVFNGTVWDDQANPGGQVPYSSNAGLVTDHPYSNNTLASPLVPEEAMGAFIGEDPNGTWTLTVSDDSSGSTGNLASWSLDVTSLQFPPVAATAAFSNETPASVANDCIQPDATSTIMVSGVGTQLGALKLTTNINHPNGNDLDITLTSPSGTVVTITTDNGPAIPFTANDVFDGSMWFDKADPDGQVPYPVFIIFPFNQEIVTDRIYIAAGLAEELVPEEALSAFNGEDPNGTWTLTVRDDSCNLLVGTLSSWSLEITTIECCVITCPAPITVGNDPGQCGAVVEFMPTDNGACGMVICSPASGSFFPVGTTTVTCTTDAGPSCDFTVTVNDVEAPVITCPDDIIAITANPGDVCVPVNFNVTATDNCPGVTVQCVEGNLGQVITSGFCFPATTTCTTVTCTATDAAGNTAECSFTVAVYDVFLEDDGNPAARELVWNSFTGDYIFCCDGTVLCGTGTARRKGSTFTLQHYTFDRRIFSTLSNSLRRGTGSLQFTSGADACSIEDRNTLNNFFDCAAFATCQCGGVTPSASGKK